ncbi:MAG: hypothetical protein F6K09_17785 [Merismopedia sp. SIO2A8]|nr:hypothetical protein [Merismopedia sp. SIO2A8]
MAVNFVAGDFTTPTNRMDIGLGRISGFSPVEPTIVVNPSDPANLAVSSHNGVRLSTNAGGSFSNVFNFTNPPGTDTFNGDTDLIFDSQGRLFWSNLAGTGTMGVSVNEIDPVTGANISTTNVRSNGDDKEFISADQTPGSPFQDSLYMVWTSNFDTSDLNEVYFSFSRDQGVNWSAPMQLSDNAGGEGFPWPSDVGVAPNGDVYVAYHAGGSSGSVGDIWVLRSTDGGQMFSQKNQAFLPGEADITFNNQTEKGSRIPQTQFWMQGQAQPWVLPDPVRLGNIYIVASDDPDNEHGTPGDDVDIVIARSTDNGINWDTETIPVNPPGGSHQFFPTAAIDEFGNIVIAWYDTRRELTNTDNNFLLDIFATYSTDGGVTWATPFMVNDSTNLFDPDIGAGIRPDGVTTRIGEYFGIDLFGGTAYVAWNGPNFGDPQDLQKQTGHQVVYDAFAIAGSLTVSGDDTGVTNDNLNIGNIAGNTDFIEVLVNSERQYAGLREALSGGITFNSLAGNDTLTIDFSNGNPIPIGSLTYDGGDGVDTISYANSPSGVFVNLATNTATDGFGGTYKLFNVENVVGSTFDDEIIGDANDNTIFAGAGKDKVSGDAGNDTLFGELA